MPKVESRNNENHEKNKVTNHLNRYMDIYGLSKETADFEE